MGNVAAKASVQGESFHYGEGCPTEIPVLKNQRTMKLHRYALAAFAALTLSTAAHAAAIVNSFSDIQYWVGSGSSQAALVIDWADGTGTGSFAWGFRWNGTATGEDMLRAIAGAIGTNTTTATADGTGDPALTLYTQFFSGFGNAVYQLDYQDHAAGGFETDSAGYWAYFTADNTASLPTSWTSSLVGMGDRTLANNSWDGWAWDEDFAFPEPAPSQPFAAAVPEPSVLALVALGGIALLRRVRSRHA